MSAMAPVSHQKKDGPLRPLPAPVSLDATKIVLWEKQYLEEEWFGPHQLECGGPGRVQGSACSSLLLLAVTPFRRD